MTFFAKKRPPGPAAELYELLTEIGMSNPELATLAGVTRNTVSRWLHRKTSPPELVLRMLRERAKRRRRRKAA